MPVDLRRDLIIRSSDAGKLQGVHPVADSDLHLAKMNSLPASASSHIALEYGLWPGIRRPPNVAGRGDETASASVEPWVDSNVYLPACLRAIYPNATPVLAYKPSLGDRVVPYNTLELAVIEARVCGGNYLLSLDPRFAADLSSGKADAVAAWKSLEATSAWLRENDALFGRPVLPSITAIVEPTQRSFELVNLLFRRNGSPDVHPITRIPAPSESRPVLMAAGIRSMPEQAAAKLLAHADAGATVVTDDSTANAWWRSSVGASEKAQADRDFYSKGKGSIVVYKRPVADPSEFAFDIIDILTHPRRAVRLWNAGSVVGVATAGASRGEAVLHTVNYGDPIEVETQARVYGVYRRAEAIAPGEKPVSLQVYKRGETTEILIPKIKRITTVVFS